MIKKNQKKLLNVGGNSKEIPVPEQYAGWQQDLLDIDPACKPDILCDARDMQSLEKDSYDVVYCSHNLEHYYLHDALKVLRGFIHVLKPDGFSHICVPDIARLMKTVVEERLDMFDVLYQSPMGPIRVCDMLYGHQRKIENSGQEYFSHKMGYSGESLKKLLLEAGFKIIAISQGKFNVTALAFFEIPEKSVMQDFNIVIDS